MCVCARECVSVWSLKARALFSGPLHRDRKVGKHIWIKSLGWVDGEVKVQIEIGLNNIQDNYLCNVDF